jgi:RNA polymerase sigma-54 factor
VNKLKQSTGTSLKKILSPQTRQAINILQMNAIDLHREIDNIILENPFLEKEETYEIDYNTIKSNYTGETDINDILNYHLDSDNLREHLMKQLQASKFSDSEKTIAIIIIDCVNDNGYLTEDLREVFIQANRLTEVTFQDIFYVLHTLQRFDPIGTCAIDLCDSLSIQLDALHNQSKYYDDAKKIIYLLSKMDINENFKFNDLFSKLNDDNVYRMQAVDLIKSLNPKPGLKIIKKLDFYQIHPDVIVFKRKDKWIIESTKNTPKLILNKDYISLMKDSKIKTDKEYLEKNHNLANFIINSIKNRNLTILNVCKEIFKKQSKFLDTGDIGLVPLTLKEIANKLDIHESTVSRATNEKYVQTPRGVFELKYFFSSELATDTGKMISSKVIMKMINELIKKEDKKRPLSDNEIAKYFSSQGITVARRTVTKYRERLIIENSTNRKVKC